MGFRRGRLRLAAGCLQPGRRSPPSFQSKWKCGSRDAAPFYCERAGEGSRSTVGEWELGGRLGHFHFMGRIKIGPYVSDTRIPAITYPDFLVRPGYVSAPYLSRIRIQNVSDTRYGPPGVSAHRWCSHIEEFAESWVVEPSVGGPRVTWATSVGSTCLKLLDQAYTSDIQSRL